MEMKIAYPGKLLDYSKMTTNDNNAEYLCLNKIRSIKYCITN